MAGGKIVQTGHMLAASQKIFAQIGAYESGSACYQYIRHVIYPFFTLFTVIIIAVTISIAVVVAIAMITVTA